MKIKTTSVTVVLMVYCLAGVAVASADTMVITYRSGKVQNVVMDQPSEEVQGISYLKTPVPLPEIKAKDLSNKPSGAEEGGRKEPSTDSKKHGVTIRWAPPIDQ